MKYCAFLRGVNVKGTGMKMVDVCQVFKDAGMNDVSSILASGNIVFSSDQDTQESKSILERAMSIHFSYESVLFIKSFEEVSLVWNSNPFEQHTDFHVYAFLGIPEVEAMLLSEVSSAANKINEKAEIAHNTFYWQVPKGNTLESAFGKILGKKQLRDKFTSRNLNTFEKILKKK